MTPHTTVALAPIDAPSLHVSLDDLPVGIEGPGHEIIGEGRRRANEHVVTDMHAVVHADVVLQLAAISDYSLRVDVDVLADDTVVADVGPITHVGVMPDARSVADIGAVLDDRCRMYSNC